MDKKKSGCRCQNCEAAHVDFLEAASAQLSGERRRVALRLGRVSPCEVTRQRPTAARRYSLQ